MGKKTTISFLVLGSAIFGWAMWRFVLDRGNTGPPTMSKDVTFVTGKDYERRDGYVDYLKAVNDIRRGQIKPEDNACVDLYRAFGPDRGMAASFSTGWKMISTELEPTGPFLEALNFPDDDLEAVERPWHDSEFPDLLQQIRANERPAEILIRASTKSAFYCPLHSGIDNGMILACTLEISQRTRDGARFLVARAMNHLANERVDECLADLLAVRSLARLVSRNGTLVEHLIGIAVDSLAIHAEKAVLESRLASSTQLQEYKQQLDQLPSFNSLINSIDQVERLATLDAVQNISFSGVQGLGVDVPPVPGFLNSFDIDIAMSIMNEHYDMLVDLARKVEETSDQSIWSVFEERMEQLDRQVVTIGFQSRLWLGGAKSRGKALGSIFVSLLIPAVQQVYEAEQRRLSFERMARLAIELEQFRISNDRYPDSLDSFDTDRLATDPFTGKRLAYQRSGDGFRLYALGPNGKDDGGVNRWEDSMPGVDGDDWRLDVNWPDAQSRDNR